MSQNISQSEWNYWYDKVYSYFYRRLNTAYETEDLTAQTLSDFFLNKAKAETDYAFLWGIARNKFYSHLRQKQKDQKVQETARIQISRKFIEQDEFSDHYLFKLSKLQECIQNQLKEQDQKILKLCVQEDFSSQEVATQLAISAVNVRTRLSRAIKKLKSKCREIWISN